MYEKHCILFVLYIVLYTERRKVFEVEEEKKQFGAPIK